MISHTHCERNHKFWSESCWRFNDALCIFIEMIRYHSCISDVFLTFTEVEKLKGMSSEQDGGNNTVCQAESLSHDLKTARQEAAQAQEKLNVTWFNLLISFDFQNPGLLKVVSVHSCAQKNTKPNEESGRRRSCHWLVRLKRQRTRGTRKWGNSLRTENASVSSKDSWYEVKQVWIWKHVTVICITIVLIKFILQAS